MKSISVSSVSLRLKFNPLNSYDALFPNNDKGQYPLLQLKIRLPFT